MEGWTPSNVTEGIGVKGAKHPKEYCRNVSMPELLHAESHNNNDRENSIW